MEPQQLGENLVIWDVGAKAFGVTDVFSDVRSEVSIPSVGDVRFPTSLHTRWRGDCHILFKHGVLLSRVLKSVFPFLSGLILELKENIFNLF